MVNSLQGDGKAIFTVFIGAIIAIVFLASIADSIFTQSTTFTNANETVTALAVNTSLTLVGRELADVPAATTWNATNGTDATNQQDNGITLSTATVDGVRTVVLTLNDTASDFVGDTINVSYIYEPEGYLERAVDRNIVSLITLFGALGALVFVIVVFIMNGSLGRLMGRGKK
ncbi:hypothetical protein LCGC14_2732940 [marine sediment metagenome]|uniref:Uncharacterized protein n=1 Tax=marine sediment metagenome TaxID=412755 RepID=A0A0F8Z6T2_9ZZZZ